MLIKPDIFPEQFIQALLLQGFRRRTKANSFLIQTENIGGIFINHLQFMGNKQDSKILRFLQFTKQTVNCHFG